MQSRIIAGIVGGLIAGVVFGVMMQMMTAPTPEGDRVPMMAMVAMGSLVGHLLYGLILGGTYAMIGRGAAFPTLARPRAPAPRT